MIFHMKTTLLIEDAVMRKLKALAGGRGVTLSSVVEDFLRRGLRDADRVAETAPALVRLPVHSMGRPTVDLADREAVDAAMEKSEKADAAEKKEKARRVRR